LTGSAAITASDTGNVSAQAMAIRRILFMYVAPSVRVKKKTPRES